MKFPLLVEWIGVECGSGYGFAGVLTHEVPRLGSESIFYRAYVKFYLSFLRETMIATRYASDQLDD